MKKEDRKKPQGKNMMVWFDKIIAKIKWCSFLLTVYTLHLLLW